MFPKTTQFEKLLEAVPDALVGVDQKGVIRFVNRQTELLFGCDREQLIGEHIDMLVPGPLWQVYVDHREDYFAKPDNRSLGVDLELIGRHQNGTEFPINVTMSLIDTGDVLLAITGVGDVTRRKQAVAKAELLDAIVEYSDDAIIGLTLDGVITSWNPAAERMYGYSSKEVIGRSHRLIPQGRAGELDAVLARIKDGQYVEHAETILVRKDGTAVPVSIAAAPIRDEDGAVVGASAVHRDVTEQRRAFEAAQRMAAIVDGSDDAIIGETLEGVITSWNPAATSMFGYSSEEIIGKSVGLLIPEDQAGEAKAVVARISAGQHVEHLETFKVRKDATVFPILLTVSPIRDADGAVVGASVICRDMTEQVQAAKVLAETSWQYRLLAENASDLVVLASPDGVITWVSPSVTRTLGWATVELLGTRLVDLIDPEDVGATAAAREVLYSGHKPASPPGGFLVRIRTKPGQYRWMSGGATPVTDESGVYVGVVSGLRDVEDLVQAQEAAEAGEAALRATLDSLLDPHVRLEAVRDESGQITDFVYVDANPAACAYNRIDYQDLIGRRLLDLQPGSVGAGLLEQYRQVVETGEPLVLDDSVYAQELLGGQPRRYDVRAARVGDGLSYTWRDVTDRRQAFETAQRLAAVIASSDDAIIARTLEGTITSWNPAADAMFGYSSAEVIGKSVDLLIPEDRVDEMVAILAKIRAGQHVDHLQTVRVRKDGTVFPVSLTVSPIRDPGGSIIGASVTGRDMTTQEHAAQHARSLIEAGLDPLVTISPEGTITDVNEAAVTATGVRREELIGTDFLHYFADLDKAKESYQMVLAQGSVSDYPLTLLHRDGTLTDVLCDASVYRDFNGTVLGVLAVARDASKLRQQQQLSVQLQAALKSRVVIEQAKGITAQRHGVTIDQAYQLIRAHARNNNASLRMVAEAIVEVGLEV
jgi:PAS domain S-box-containing protein